MLSVITPRLVEHPSPSHNEVSESVFEVLSKTMKFTTDSKFWWDTVGRALAKMLCYSGYSVNSQFLHLFFFYMRVAPYMGPRPGKDNHPAFESYMTDDHTPVELSWVVNSEGRLVVRYAVEPIDDFDSACSGRPAALQMLDSLRPVMSSAFDLRWFDILESSLVWHGSVSGMKTKHGSQYFLGFDCSHSGDAILKAYFMPEVRSAQTGVPKEEIVSRALSRLDVGFESAWEDIICYFATLSLSVKPEIEIVATDCSAPEVSRIKIYVRTRSTRFTDLEGLMTLGGSLNGALMQSSMEALEALWHDVMGIDTTVADWKDQPLSPRDSSGDGHLTGGLLLYYELKPGHQCSFPKVYLPVRHYCPDDFTIASNIEKYYTQRNNSNLHEYTSAVQEIFGRHRPLDTRTGIHTYLSLAIKKSIFEITSYFNPEIFAPERLVA